jgi:hypothetical protein
MSEKLDRAHVAEVETKLEQAEQASKQKPGGRWSSRADRVRGTTAVRSRLLWTR